MNKEKRERSANFTTDERDLLIHFIRKYEHIISNKKNDGATWKKKALAWKVIEKEFNAKSKGPLRSTKTLRLKYEGMKKNSRKKSGTTWSPSSPTSGRADTPSPSYSDEIKINKFISLRPDKLVSVSDSNAISSIPTDEKSMESVFFPTPKDNLDPISETDCGNLDKAILNKQYDLDETKISAAESFLKVEIKVEPPPEEHDIINGKEIDTETTEECPQDGFLKYVPCASTSSCQKEWNERNRQNFKPKKRPAFTAVTPKKNFALLIERKMELVKLQKELLEAEIIQKKKEWEFKEKERIWIEHEYMLKLAKLKKELND